VAETERQKSAELRRKTAPKKQENIRKVEDVNSLRNAFDPASGQPYLSTSVDQYGKYILVEIDPTTGQESKIYLTVDKDGRTWQRITASEMIKKVKEAYKNPEALRTELYSKGYIDERDYVTKNPSALNAAILEAGTEFSTEIADSFTTEGKFRFPTFDSWITARADYGKDSGGPRRDINLMDRDVVKALVEDVYMSENMQLPTDPSVIEAKVDRYMDMIKKGRLTTTKEGAGKTPDEIKTTAGFSEARLRAELQAEIPKEQPIDYQRAQSLNFLTFLGQME